MTQEHMIRTALETIIECAPQVAPEARFALRLFNEMMSYRMIERDEYNTEWLAALAR